MTYMTVESPESAKKPRIKKTRFSRRCFCTAFIISFIFIGIIALMVVIPVVQHVRSAINENKNTPSTSNKKLDPTKGPIPVKKKLVEIDPLTPNDARYIDTHLKKETWELVYSDEFEEDFRKFGPGEDPAWEAVDLWYESTGDEEYYDPDQVTTMKGNLVIQVDKKKRGDLEYTSGMLQSWNKVCFTGGRIEVRASLPGEATKSGFWPGAWLLGNLARAGYKSTTDGVWPYSYDSCDEGTAKNQTWTEKSHLIGQRLSKCVCPGEDHPNPGTGRGAPEIDLIEALASPHKGGEVSQSLQIAPFDIDRKAKASGMKIHNSSETTLNSYLGSELQQSLSALSTVPSNFYGGRDFSVFAVEYQPGPDGYITWFVDGIPTWSVEASAIGPNADAKVSQRLIPEEPMSIILNLALSSKFSPISADLVFPGYFLIDYVRIYQHPDRKSLTCDPKDYPTKEYIEKHPNAYYNKNWTHWDLAGYKTPKGSYGIKC